MLYGIPAWGQASQCDLKKILTLQKRALHLIFFASKRSHAIPLFVDSNILPVNMLYFETVSTIMHDVSTHSTPKNIRELFIHASDVHAYNTRFSGTDNLFVQKSRLNMKLKVALNSFRVMDRYDHSLSLDTTIMVSKNCPTIGEHVVTTFVTQ